MTQDQHPGNGAYSEAGAAIVRQTFGSQEIERRRETTAIAAAEHAKASVQARYLVAMQRPRDLDDFRVRLLKHCKRPGFAAMAEYAKPVGGSKARGMSIRFVEAALQEFGNVLPESVVVFDDDEKLIIRVSLTDLERNITYVEDATVWKFVERKSPSGAEVIGERRKANGEVVYKVRANDDDFANKLGAATSKKIRNLGLRVLPSDIVEECKLACAATRANESAKDPDADRKRLTDAFAELRVMPSDLKDYLGHDIGTATPAEIDDLRLTYAAIRDGEATWVDTMRARREERGEVESKNDPGADALRKKLAKNAAKDQAAAEGAKP